MATTTVPFRFMKEMWPSGPRKRGHESPRNPVQRFDIEIEGFPWSSTDRPPKTGGRLRFFCEKPKARFGKTGAAFMGQTAFSTWDGLREVFPLPNRERPGPCLAASILLHPNCLRGCAFRTAQWTEGSAMFTEAWPAAHRGEANKHQNVPTKENRDWAIRGKIGLFRAEEMDAAWGSPNGFPSRVKGTPKTAPKPSICDSPVAIPR